VTAGHPTLGFLFRHPAHCIALGFGAGLAPGAPGTFGTLVALPIAAGLWTFTDDAGFLAAIAILFAIGIWAAATTGRDLGVADHPAIVWDEVVAFLLVLFFVGSDDARVAIAFLLFRLFDIVKPPPIRQLDRGLKNGFGVMADDIVAAGYTLLVFAVWQRLWGG
jgi:phosphatidylglycerophosphatase A